MDTAGNWHDLGDVEALKGQTLRQVSIGRTKIALTYKDGRFSAVSGVCNHVGGPLGDGHLEGDYLVCPWHHYKYHCATGEGEPGFEDDRVPRYDLAERDGHLFINLDAVTKRNKPGHEPHPLARPLRREAGAPRILGLSTTAMDAAYPRYSTSDALLVTALQHAESLGAETKLIKLNDLRFRHCEGYYSKAAHACTWPCSITQMDPEDELDRVYEGIVHWCDAVIVSTPIRWGSASSLYFKMVERMNCVQNQITIANNVLIRNKTAAFIITGGQDNIQGVAGNMLTFFSELGFDFPQFPFIAHSRGWSAEDMENNVAFVQRNRELHDGARELAARTLDKARSLIDAAALTKIARGGRKAHHMVGVEE